MVKIGLNLQLSHTWVAVKNTSECRKAGRADTSWIYFSSVVFLPSTDDVTCNASQINDNQWRLLSCPMMHLVNASQLTCSLLTVTFSFNDHLWQEALSVWTDWLTLTSLLLAWVSSHDGTHWRTFRKSEPVALPIGWVTKTSVRV